MKEAKIPDNARSWDRYQAFHCRCEKHGFSRTNEYHAAPIILFDTGEVIITDPRPGPDVRGHYPNLGITLTTSNDVHLWDPDGKIIARAWLDDSGMQYLLADDDTGHVVRLDCYRHAPQVTLGIPRRFQYNCYGYIGGPGLKPVSHGGIKVSIPLQKVGYTPEQLEHIHMIVATGQAAMKLTNHVAVSIPATRGANPDIILRCKTWQDMPEAQLPMLAHRGAGRVERQYPYLLAKEPV